MVNSPLKNSTQDAGRQSLKHVPELEHCLVANSFCSDARSGAQTVLGVLTIVCAKAHARELMDRLQQRGGPV